MKTKVNDFSGMNIYAGIDVHKMSWSVMDGVQLEALEWVSLGRKMLTWSGTCR